MNFGASGKLMLFGEYLILKGSQCLASPLRFGQHLQVDSLAEKQINWISKNYDEVWFSARSSSALEVIETTDSATAEKLIEILKIIRSIKPDLFNGGLNFQTTLDFNSDWGFGSSSTLISLLSQWAKIDPYFLLQKSFGGSGYDIACATAMTPIFYDMQTRQTIPVYLFPKVTSKLLFIYTGKKQNSQKEVEDFQSVSVSESDVAKMTQIILTAAKATQIDVFENCMEESEELLSGILNISPIKKEFEDYPYFLKSLGAWGGDFFMATYRKENEARTYFSERGYPVQFTYNEIIKR
jgi:mevalonate kinase